MAKGNALLGTMTGKVGDVIFFRRNGQQMERAYQPQVRDANTNGQRLQRAILANVTRIINELRPLCQNWVQHKPDRSAAIAYLCSRSLRYQRNMAVQYWRSHEDPEQPLTTTPVPLGVEECKMIVPSSVIVSKGSLSQRCFLPPAPSLAGSEVHWATPYDPASGAMPLNEFAALAELEDGDYYTFVALTTDPANRAWQDEEKNLFIENCYLDYVTLQVVDGVREKTQLFTQWPQAFNVVNASTQMARNYFSGALPDVINTFGWTQGGFIRGANLYAGAVAVVRSKADGRCSTAWLGAAWQHQTAEVSGISPNFVPLYWGNT